MITLTSSKENLCMYFLHYELLCSVANLCSTFICQITKELAGASARSALWASSVGNEIGQVLMTVLTAQEGSGLEVMCKGLVDRYDKAKVQPPALMYTDRDCCSSSGVGKTKASFAAWPNLITLLDIWHFMRRIAVGVTTDAHQLYGPFMAALSDCIFEWDLKLQSYCLVLRVCPKRMSFDV